MAVYYLDACIKSGGHGKSAIASSAYITGQRIFDEIEKTVKRPSLNRRERVRATGVLSPPNAPDWANNREKLWNEVMKKEGPRGQYCRSWIIGLPKELSLQQQTDLAEKLIKKSFVDRGMVADYAIHIDKKGTNPHLHILTTMRSFREDGTWAPKTKKVFERDKDGKAIFSHRDKRGKKIYKTHQEFYNNWNTKETFMSLRAEFADSINAALAEYGFNARVSHESNKKRGIEKLPMVHEGYAARAIERKGGVSVRCEYNRKIRAFNKAWKAYRNEQTRRMRRRAADQTRDAEKTRSIRELVRPQNLRSITQLPSLSDMRKCGLDAFQAESDMLLRSDAHEHMGQHGQSARERSAGMFCVGADSRKARTSEPAGFKSLSPDDRITLIVQSHHELVARERAVERERRRLCEALIRNTRLNINRKVADARKKLESVRAERVQNAGRLDELRGLLSDKYREDMEPSGLLAVRDRKRWREERAGVQDEIARCQEQDGKLTARVKRAEKTLSDAQKRQQDAIGKMVDKQVLQKHPELQAVREACKALSSSVKRIERQAEQLAGKRGRNAVKSAVTAAASKPTMPQAKAVAESVTRGAGLPTTLIGNTNDSDKWMRNWALITEAAKEEESNKRVYHDI